jgi:hypothetical protein
MARRKQATKGLTGIRHRGGRYQFRLFGGQDPVTGKQVMLTGSAEDEDAAIKLRDKFRRLVAEATAARTSVDSGARTPRSCDRRECCLPAVGVACRWLSQDEHAVGLEVDPRAEAAADPVEDGLQPRRVLA